VFELPSGFVGGGAVGGELDGALPSFGRLAIVADLCEVDAADLPGGRLEWGRHVGQFVGLGDLSDQSDGFVLPVEGGGKVMECDAANERGFGAVRGFGCRLFEQGEAAAGEGGFLDEASYPASVDEQDAAKVGGDQRIFGVSFMQRFERGAGAGMCIGIALSGGDVELPCVLKSELCCPGVVAVRWTAATGREADAEQAQGGVGDDSDVLAG